MDLDNLYSDSEVHDGFAVHFLSGKGRHLVATKRFAPGSIILEQDPYVSALSDERTPGFCDFCFRSCERPLRCSRSKLARYCCKEHQRLAWLSGYKIECEALVRCAPRVPPPTVRLAARLLWRRARSLAQQQPLQQAPQQQWQPTAGQMQPPYGRHVHHQPPWESDHEGLWRLEHHWEQLDDRRKQLYAQMAVVTRQYMYGTQDGPCPMEDADGDGDAVAAGASAMASSQAALLGAWPGFRAVAQLLSMLACNCHTVCDEELRPLGIALYPTGALVNHSCSPSAVQTFRGNTLQLRALRLLQPGEEITIAYIELAATRQERRETLADSYFFDINATDAPLLLGAVTATPQPAPAPPHSVRPWGDADAIGRQLMEADDGAGPSVANVAEFRRIAQVGNCGSSNSSGGAGDGDRGRPCSSFSHVRPMPLLTLDVAPNAQLHVYSALPGGQPPWLADPQDGELTRVDMSCGGIGPGDVSSFTSQVSVQPLPGGLLARLVPGRPNEQEEEEDQPQEESEEEGQQQQEELVGGDPNAQQGGVGPTVSSTGFVSELRHPQADMQLDGNGASGKLRVAAAGAELPPRLMLPGAPVPSTVTPRPPRIELMAWGSWLKDLVQAAAARGGGSDRPADLGPAGTSRVQEEIGAGTGLRGCLGYQVGVGSCAAGRCGRTSSTQPIAACTQAAVASLMRRCVAALQLSHQAEAGLGSGGAGKVFDTLQRALRLLDDAYATEPHEQLQLSKPGPTQEAAGLETPLSLGSHHILRLRLRAQLLKAAIDMGSSGWGAGAVGIAAASAVGSSMASDSWNLALYTARALEPQYRYCYPHPGWPNLSLHYATLAKLEMLLGRPRRALRAASQALEGLRLTHGGPSSGGWEGGGGVVEQVVRTAREAEMELQTWAQKGIQRGGYGKEELLGDDDC